MFTFDDDEQDEESQVETTYRVRVKDGRTVTMIGDMQDLDEITQMMRQRAAAPDLLAACEKLVNYRDRAGAINFQLEKADDYIRMIRAAIAAA